MLARGQKLHPFSTKGDKVVGKGLNKYQQIVFVMLLATGGVVTISDATKGNLPRPRSYIGLMMVALGVGTVSIVAPELAAIFSVLIFLGTLFGEGSHGGTIFQGLQKATSLQTLPNAKSGVGFTPGGLTPSTPGSFTITKGGTIDPLGALSSGVQKIIGFPYQGSHTLYGNWESDNAIDIQTPIGTPVYAIAPGTIGSEIGPINSTDPHLQGQRLHLVTGNNEYYYAHLSQIVVKPGQRVKAGTLLGYSGSANGVQHLHIASKYGNPTSLFPGSH